MATFHGNSYLHYLNDTFDGDLFFVPAHELFIVQESKDRGSLLLFPETPVFFQKPQGLGTVFISFKKIDGEISIDDKITPQNTQISLKKNSFYGRLDLQGVYVIEVNLVDYNSSYKDESALAMSLKATDHITERYEHKTIHELHLLLSESVENEEYERSAQIRDEISRRK